MVSKSCNHCIISQPVKSLLNVILQVFAELMIYNGKMIVESEIWMSCKYSEGYESSNNNSTAIEKQSLLNSNSVLCYSLTVQWNYKLLISPINHWWAFMTVTFMRGEVSMTENETPCCHEALNTCWTKHCQCIINYPVWVESVECSKLSQFMWNSC